ncbi:Fc.00g003320.m01.CDS01 [Cosmosporella sp. VM-42]
MKAHLTTPNAKLALTFAGGDTAPAQLGARTELLCEFLKGMGPRWQGTSRHVTRAKFLWMMKSMPCGIQSRQKAQEPTLECMHSDDLKFITRGKADSQGFIYNIPYITNIAYPEELLDMLKEFARDHPPDKILPAVMLHALQLWVDIIESPEHTLKPIYATNTISVPVAHEFLRCLEYSHPFRIISHMYTQDILANAHGFVINDAIINQDRVMELTRPGRPIVPEHTVESCRPHFPFFANGTTMTAPRDMGLMVYPSLAEQALIGMPGLRVLGLPSWHRQESWTRRLAMPKVLADIGFHGLETVLLDRNIEGFWEPSSPGIVSLVGRQRCYGPIWAHHFHPGENNNAAIRLRGRELAMSQAPLDHLVHFLDPVPARLIINNLRRQLDCYEQLGVMGGTLQISARGALYIEGAPEPDEAFLLAPIDARARTLIYQQVHEIHTQDQAQQQDVIINHPIPSPSLSPEPEPEPQPDLVPDDHMDRLTAAVGEKRRSMHSAGVRAYELFRLLRAPDQVSTVVEVIGAIESAIVSDEGRPPDTRDITHVTHVTHITDGARD